MWAVILGLWEETALLLIGGFLAGIVNTISGSGTLFSLGALILLDVPIILANTTTRPGVFVQNFSGLWAIRRYGRLSFGKIPWGVVVSTTFGALVGAYFAVNVSDRLLTIVASFAMALSMWMILFPGSVPLSSGKNLKLLVYIKYLLFWAVGFYGGFIQIGVGLFMLAVITTLISDEYRYANTLKLIIILIYTVPTTIYFVIGDQILWRAAILLAVGQFGGAYLAGFFLVVNKNAKFWSKLLTVIFIIITLVEIWVF